MSPLKIHKQGVTVAVRLTPGARHEGFDGLVDAGDGGTALKVSVRAPPEEGRANRELLRLLAEAWVCPKHAVSLLSGETSRRKVVLVEGDPASIFQKLEQWLARKG